MKPKLVCTVCSDKIIKKIGYRFDGEAIHSFYICRDCLTKHSLHDGEYKAVPDHCIGAAFPNRVGEYVAPDGDRYGIFQCSDGCGKSLLWLDSEHRWQEHT